MTRVKAGMDHVLGYKCTICGAEYSLDEIDYVCPEHGAEGIVDIVYDYPLLKSRLGKVASSSILEPQALGMWRFKSLLPVELASRVPGLVVGGTPLYNASRLGSSLGLKNLWVKDDSANPSASLKDRASAIAVVKAQEKSAEVLTTASTGNAAAALACLSASAGVRAVIFVPKTAPPAKIAQQLIYGARVLLVDGTYDDAFDLAIEAANAFGWYNRNTGYNPYMSEGKKTVVYEICEQLDWHTPDRIFVPVGDGCIIGAVYKGLHDLLALGWIDRMPRLVGVQAAGSSPLVRAWEDGLPGWEMVKVDAHTRADSICAGLPRDRNKALAAVRKTDGAFIAVEDQEILDAIPVIAQQTGVFCEPAAAAAYAGLARMVQEGKVRPDEHIVLLLTGSGLKDIASAMAVVPEPPVIVSSLSAVRTALDQGV
ncbi:MAG: threonine synthase [Anaerolineae bacterium]|nr:threonine synthase [Anaerolineae bacterium]